MAVQVHISRSVVRQSISAVAAYREFFLSHGCQERDKEKSPEQRCTFKGMTLLTNFLQLDQPFTDSTNQ